MLLITGVTCSGKTQIAEAISKRIPSEIISLDSRCLYKDVMIGNGKFTMDMDLSYHMIDILGLDERMTVHSFLEKALPLSLRIRERGRVPVACGGSMLYIDRLVKGLDPGPRHDQHCRSEIEDLMDDLGPWETHKMLKEMDHIKALSIHPMDRKRISRALNSCFVASNDHLPGIGSMNYEWRGFFIDREGHELLSRIKKRASVMLDRGWINEVKCLLSRGAPVDSPGLDMTGVKYIIHYLNGLIKYDDMFEMIVRSNMELIRNQRKWIGRLGFRTIIIRGDDVHSSVSAILDEAPFLYE